MTLNIRREQTILALGDPEQTPRARAEAHGLTLLAYLALVYDYEPKPPADASAPRPRAPGAWELREARARRVVAALEADPCATDEAIMRAAGAPRGVVRHIRAGRTWQHLRGQAAPLTLRQALERRKAG